MKILFYINVLSGGGAERVLANLATAFCEHGHEVTIVTSLQTRNEYAVSPTVHRYQLDGEKKHGVIVKNIQRIRGLKKILKQEKPDVAVSFMAEPNYRLILAARKLPIKTIISVRNDPCREYNGHLARFFAKHLLPKADGCVFQTPMAQSFFPAKLQQKSVIIQNEVAASFFNQVWCPVDGEFMTAGRLTKQKNHNCLIQAFAKLAPRHPKAHLTIYGDGPLKQDLLQLIEQLKLQDRVTCGGFTGDISEKLAKANVFVLSSDYEGMPNALLEALSVGVPCISTDCPCGGPRAVITNGENGLLVPINNVDALAAAMERVLDDTQLQQKLSIAAKHSARIFEPEVVFNEWHAYVQKVMNT